MNGKQLMTAKERDAIVPLVTQKIANDLREGFQFPANYSYTNALKEAWLHLTQMEFNYQPILNIVTAPSVIESVYGMLIQGLSVVKKQCFFIKRGDKLTLLVSYNGVEKLFLATNPGATVNPQIIYEGDEFEYDIVHGVACVTKHKSNLANRDNPITGGYCVLTFPDGNKHVEIMTIKEIHQTWKKSAMKVVQDNGKIKPDSVHDEFPQEMAKRTLINRACKRYIRSSDDSDKRIAAFHKSLDIEYDIVDDTPPALSQNFEAVVEEKQKEKKQKKQQQVQEIVQADPEPKEDILPITPEQAKIIAEMLKEYQELGGDVKALGKGIQNQYEVSHRSQLNCNQADEVIATLEDAIENRKQGVEWA